MFKKKKTYVELEARTPSQPVKVAGADLEFNRPQDFKLTQRVEVEHIVINRGSDGLEVMLGTDDGHFIKVKVIG